MSGINGMNMGGNNYNISLPIIASSQQMQNGNGHLDNSYMYNINANNNPNMPYSQRRSETPNVQSSNYIMSEIKNMKHLIKATYESQTEMQGKIIEYNRIIAQQENIIRLNNIKLSEHDTKLTDILLSFDNYLKLHDKTTKIVNEVQRRLDNTVSISDYSEFKSNYYSTKAIIDNQIASLYHTNEETQMKVIESTKENKRLQEYILDKVKNVENNLTHTILDYQRNTIKIQEAKDQSINGQFNHVTSLIQIVESNLNEEKKYRKSLLDNFKNEIFGLFKQFEDKCSRLEKSQLETEKNLICLNKDYVGTFQELLSNQKDKSDIECNSLRSLIEASLSKTKLTFDENLNVMKEKMNILSSGIEEQRTTFADLEVFVKDNVKSFNERIDNSNHAEMDTKGKLETLHNALNNYMKESMVNIAKMQQEANQELYNKMHNEVVELEQQSQKQLDSNTKGVSDLNEKTDQITNTLQVLSQMNSKSGDYVNMNEVSSLKKKLDDFQQKTIELEARLKNEYTTKIEELIPKNRSENNAMIDSINDRIDKIIQVLKRDLKNGFDTFKATIEGNAQGFVVESENRINEHFNKEISSLQEAIETIMIKYGNKNND